MVPTFDLQIDRLKGVLRRDSSLNRVVLELYAESSLLNVVYTQDLRIGELLELGVKKIIVFSIFSIFSRI